MSSSAKSWWAASSAQARVTTLGGVVLAAALTVVSYVVWTSPSGPVGTVVDAVQEAERNPLLDQRNELLSEVVALQKQLTESDQDVSDLLAKLQATEQALAEAQAAADANAAPPSTPPAGGSGPKPGAVPPPPEPVTEGVTAPPKADLLQPAGNYAGLYTAQAPFNWATFDDASTKSGALPSVVGYFGGWDQSYRGDAVSRSWARGMLPMLTWESRPMAAPNSQVDEPEYSIPAILGDPASGTPGAFDDYLHQYARDIVATGLPLAIRFDHEMNGQWYPWSEDDGRGGSINGNRPGDYVKLWQYVHDIFESEGANEYVIWVWSPNIINNLPSTHKTFDYLASLYPGDEYVDWVGLSGYLRPPYKEENNFTFDYTFGASLAQLRELTDKPIYLAEVGASEIDGHKIDWITSFFESMADPANDDIIGFSWFSLAVTSYVEGELATNDWRIDSRPETLAAYIAGLTRPENQFLLTPFP